MARAIPDTQRKAYEKVDRPSAREKVLREIREAKDGKTLFELVRGMGWDVNRISGRVTELRKAGLIRDTGNRRANPNTGAKAIVWEVTPCPSPT